MDKNNSRVPELKDEWSNNFGNVNEIKKGDYIGFPLSEIKMGYIYDVRDEYEEKEDEYPYMIDPKSYKEKIEDKLLILQYLGNSEFLELISGHTIICWGSDLIPPHEILQPSKSAIDFQTQTIDFLKKPLMLFALEDYAFPLSNELKILYANTTLKKQDSITSILDDMSKKSKESIIEGLKEIAAKDQDKALENHENEIFSVDRFIESHSRKL